MAWMFAGTENDMSVGMHLHYHYVPPLMPPVPFYPHPALGIARDKFASKTKVNNRKAARTGTKFKILLPPHLPLLGPLTHGVGKEGTGIQTGWMGAGIGAHPFGGIGFVVIEGKPALGFLSNLLGCWCVAPGFDMMLPFIGLDFLMIPTHAPTVLYGPAPLAIDLLVMLMALVEALLDWLIGKIQIPILQEIAEVGKNAIMEGMETACTAYESGVRPISACLAAGAQAAAYSFVDGMVEFAVGKVTGPLGNIPVVGGVVQDWAKGEIHEAANDAIGEHVLGEGYNDYLAKREADRAASGPTPGGVFGAIDKVGTAFGKGANANAQAHAEQAQAQAGEMRARGATDAEIQQQIQVDPGVAIGVGLDNAVRDFGREQVQNNVAQALTPPGQEPGLLQNMAGAVVGGAAVPARPLPPLAPLPPQVEQQPQQDAGGGDEPAGGEQGGGGDEAGADPEQAGGDRGQQDPPVGDPGPQQQQQQDPQPQDDGQPQQQAPGQQQQQQAPAQQQQQAPAPAQQQAPAPAQQQAPAPAPPPAPKPAIAKHWMDPGDPNHVQIRTEDGKWARLTHDEAKAAGIDAGFGQSTVFSEKDQEIKQDRGTHR